MLFDVGPIEHGDLSEVDDGRMMGMIDDVSEMFSLTDNPSFIGPGYTVSSNFPGAVTGGDAPLLELCPSAQVPITRTPCPSLMPNPSPMPRNGMGLSPTIFEEVSLASLQ